MFKRFSSDLCKQVYEHFQLDFNPVLWLKWLEKLEFNPHCSLGSPCSTGKISSWCGFEKWKWLDGRVVEFVFIPLAHNSWLLLLPTPPTQKFWNQTRAKKACAHSRKRLKLHRSSMAGKKCVYIVYICLVRPLYSSPWSRRVWRE